MSNTVSDSWSIQWALTAPGGLDRGDGERVDIAGALVSPRGSAPKLLDLRRGRAIEGDMITFTKCPELL